MCSSLVVVFIGVNAMVELQQSLVVRTNGWVPSSCFV